MPPLDKRRYLYHHRNMGELTNVDDFVHMIFGDPESAKKKFDLIVQVIQDFSNGQNLLQALQLRQLTMLDFLSTLRQFPSLAHTFTQCQAYHDVAYKERLVHIVDAASLEDWKAAAFLLERQFPQEFGKKVEHTTAPIEDQNPKRYQEMYARYERVPENENKPGPETDKT